VGGTWQCSCLIIRYSSCRDLFESLGIQNYRGPSFSLDPERRPILGDVYMSLTAGGLDVGTFRSGRIRAPSIVRMPPWKNPLRRMRRPKKNKSAVIAIPDIYEQRAYERPELLETEVQQGIVQETRRRSTLHLHSAIELSFAASVGLHPGLPRRGSMRTKY
jgi:hypothetical protein